MKMPCIISANEVAEYIFSHLSIHKEVKLFIFASWYQCFSFYSVFNTLGWATGKWHVKSMTHLSNKTSCARVPEYLGVTHGKKASHIEIE